MATPSAFDFNADNSVASFSPLRAVFWREMAMEMGNGEWQMQSVSLRDYLNVIISYQRRLLLAHFATRLMLFYRVACHLLFPRIF